MGRGRLPYSMVVIDTAYMRDPLSGVSQVPERTSQLGNIPRS